MGYIEKPKRDNARKLRGIYLIDLVDKEFKEPIQNARKKLELPKEAAMPCKLKTFRHRELVANPTKSENQSMHAS